MRLFMFKSEGNRGLHAFAPDAAGEQLPKRHGPWTAVGVVREDKNPRNAPSASFLDRTATANPAIHSRHGNPQGFRPFRLA